MENNNIRPFEFRAIDPYVLPNIILPTEKDSRRGFISWGEANDYPEYLNTLYKEVPTLHSIIDGTADYITGDGVEIEDPVFSLQVNRKGDNMDDIVRLIALDHLKYGGFALNVLRNRGSKVAEIHHIPFERIRLNEDKSLIYYSKEWSKSFGRVKFITYPKFDPKDLLQYSSVYVYAPSPDVYPSPKWAAATTSAEMERKVNEYHLNSISNGFSASYLISFNNGIPNEQQADEIEEKCIEKFTGSGNGGRLVINFANDKEHSAELTKLETDDAGEKYNSLIERSKSEIFTSFRATPNLFGLPTATGFSNEEYQEAFKLYNRTMILPIQNIITRSLSTILGKDITIKPFKLNE